MEGLVLEVKEKTIILISPQGAVVEQPLPSGDIIVGQKVHIDAASERRRLQLRTALAYASVLIVCLVSVSGYGYTQPFGVVNLDINPSFQMTYNAFEQVLDVKSLDRDSSLVLQGQPSFRHQTVPMAVQTLITAAHEKGFIPSNKQSVIYYAVSDRYSAGREERLLSVLRYQALGQEAQIIRVLLKGSPQMYRMTIGQEASPIPELMKVARSSNGQRVLYYSDIPIQDIGKPTVPEEAPSSEIKSPMPSYKSPAVEEIAPDGAQEKNDYQKKKKAVPQNSPVFNSDTEPLDSTRQHLQKPEADHQPKVEYPADTATPATPSNESKMSPDDTGGTTSESKPTESAAPGNNSKNSPSPGKGNNGNNDGGSSIPGKGGGK